MIDKVADEKTVLIITHSIGYAQLCDRILFMSEGKIIEEGTHASLLTSNGRYAAMFHAQEKLYNE